MCIIQVAECEEMEQLSPRSKPLQRSCSSESKESSTTEKTEKPDKEGASKKSTATDKKITSVAKQVTSRLYKPPEPKFKYVPKVKEKEVKPVPRTKVVRDRNNEVKPWAQPVKGVRDFDRSKSESPQRVTSKRTSPSPRRDIEPKKRSTSAPLKDNKQKQGGSKKKDSGNKNEKDDNDKSKVSAAQNKTPPIRTKSPTSGKSVAVSPDRRLAVVGSNAGRTGPPVLRHMTSASSLASVPESLSEHEEGHADENQTELSGTKYPVKKRQKKGRANFLDDGFRCHSAPDSERMSKDFDKYAEQIDSGFPNIVSASVSVDDSDICKEENLISEISEEAPADIPVEVHDALNLSIESETERQLVDTVPQTDESVLEDQQIFENDEIIKHKSGDDYLSDNSLDLGNGSCSDENDTVVVLGKREHETDSTTDIPNKRSKPLHENRTVENEAFSDDSLDADISLDSLEGNEVDLRLTQSLPNYLLPTDKPMSDDSLSEKENNTSFENDNADENVQINDLKNEDEIDTSNRVRHNLNDSGKLSLAEVQCYEFVGKPSSKGVFLAKSAVDVVQFMPTGECANTVNSNTEEEYLVHDNGTMTVESSNVGTSSKFADKESGLKLVVLPNIEFLGETVEGCDKISQNLPDSDCTGCIDHVSNILNEGDCETLAAFPKELNSSQISDSIATSLDNSFDVPLDSVSKDLSESHSFTDAKNIDNTGFDKNDDGCTEAPNVLDTHFNGNINVNVAEEMLQNDAAVTADKSYEDHPLSEDSQPVQCPAIGIEVYVTENGKDTIDIPSNGIMYMDKECVQLNLGDNEENLPTEEKDSSNIRKEQIEVSSEPLYCPDKAEINVVASNLTYEMFQNEKENALSCERDNDLNKENELSHEGKDNIANTSEHLFGVPHRITSNINDTELEEDSDTYDSNVKTAADAYGACGNNDSLDSNADSNHEEKQGSLDENHNVIESMEIDEYSESLEPNNENVEIAHQSPICSDAENAFEGRNAAMACDLESGNQVSDLEKHGTEKPSSGIEVHASDDAIFEEQHKNKMESEPQEQSNENFEHASHDLMSSHTDNDAETENCGDLEQKSISADPQTGSYDMERSDNEKIENTDNDEIELELCKEHDLRPQSNDTEKELVGIKKMNNIILDTDHCSDLENGKKVSESEKFDAERLTSPIETSAVGDFNETTNFENVNVNASWPLSEQNKDSMMPNPEEQQRDRNVLDIIALTRSIGVGTSFELFDAGENSEIVDNASQASNDSFLLDPEKELEVLQEALEQLPAKYVLILFINYCIKGLH